KDHINKEDLSNNYKLVLLIEECSEVIHAATKCLRFGTGLVDPDYGNNLSMLSREVGELQAIIDRTYLDRAAFNAAYFKKWDRVLKVAEKNGKDIHPNGPENIDKAYQSWLERYNASRNALEAH